MKSRPISFLSVSSLLSVAITTLGIAPTCAAQFSKQIHDTGNLHSQPRIAQVFRSTFTLPSGQAIVTRLIGEETLYVNSGQRLPAKLQVEQDIIGNNGTVVIPAGATIEGEFAPANGGSKFIARTLTSRGATVAISAESDIILDTKDPRETSIGAIATDVAIGAAGASVLAAVTGDRAIATEEVLAGAAAGGIIGNVTAPNATVIDPKSAISLTTSRSLTFTRGGD